MGAPGFPAFESLVPLSRMFCSFFLFFSNLCKDYCHLEWKGGEGSFQGRNTVLVEDVEITAPHVCIVMKRPPEPMHISRNIGKYPPKESLCSALWPTMGKGPANEHRGHPGLSGCKLGRFTQVQDNCARAELLYRLLVIQPWGGAEAGIVLFL